MKKFLLGDLIKANIDDEISILLARVKSGDMSLDSAQEDAWVIYGYEEGGIKGSSHKSSTWGELFFGGDTTVRIEISWEPIFESLGAELDDEPFYTGTIYITTNNNKYPHAGTYPLTIGPEKRSEITREEIQSLIDSSSVMKWFNENVRSTPKETELQPYKG